MRRNPAQMPSPLDSFIPTPDVRERFQKTIKAPADIVMEIACNFDLQSLHIVRLIFRLRDRFMRVPKIETRVVATDAEAKTRFRGYWRWARFGIISIRLILMPAVRRASEKRWNTIQGLNREIS